MQKIFCVNNQRRRSLMEEYFSCTKSGSNDFMPVVRMQGRGNYSLSSPVSNWAGVKCSDCGTFHDESLIAPYLNSKYFK